MNRILYLLIVLCSLTTIKAQETIVFGRVTSTSDGKPVDFAIANIEGTSNVAETDSLGQFRLVVTPDENFRIIVTRIGYGEASLSVTAMKPGSKRYLTVKLAPREEAEVVVTASRIIDGGMVREEVSEFKLLPNASGNFESVLPNIALGVSSGTGGELSSQYNVRGGNYDENLIYVNDFEIFRPQLIRAGQQEGLSFPNIDMIRDLSFSSGGYQSKYGDKMASVLDIRYKRPEETKGSISGSLLGASAHLEGSQRLGANAYNKLRYILGARYKTNKYLLGSLDVQGEYVPNFIDLQGYITYDITKDLQLGVIGNFSDSKYSFIPASRSTAIGGFTFAVKLTSVFEGGEKDVFTNGMTGTSLTYVPSGRKNPMFLKLMASRFSSNEQENIDILGYYRLAQIETNFGSDEFGQEIALLGVGTQHNYVRNYLYYNIRNLEHKGGIEFSKPTSNGKRSNFLQWGLKGQLEFYDDRINEWERIDSADYSIPYNGETIELANVLKSKNELVNTKVNGYFQNTFSILKNQKYDLQITAGLRASYLELNKELLFSPRASIAYQPLENINNLSFTLAGGTYYQSPFYRELRRIDGTVNNDVKSQKSSHLVFGMNYDFFWKKVGQKPFRLITEVYYKKFDALVSYDVDNVRIRYSGDNDAVGYAAGLDLRINGEFVPGAESWLNIGILKTSESILGVQHLRRSAGDTIPTSVKYVPRPTDRLVTVNLFFQDYLPKNENFRVNVNLSFGTGLPFGVKDDNIIYRNTFRFKAYHRADLGFIYQVWDQKKAARNPDHWLNFSKSLAVSLEVFNLLKVQNPASNTWIKTIINDQYAITNNLTSRRINLKLRAEF